MDIKAKVKKAVKETRNYFVRAGKNKAVIGLSGGIDSAVAATIVCRAIGRKNLTALLMPAKGISSEKGVSHAKEIVGKLKIKAVYQPITDVIKSTAKIEWTQSRIAKANTMARARAMLLYNYANSNNCLVVGTGNKSELMLGYFTKYGDGAADVLVIGNFWKTEVFEAAEELGLPGWLIEKVPAAELMKGQTDEKELGASYEELDRVLKLVVEKKLTKRQIIGQGNSRKLVENVWERIKASEHKRMPPEIIKIGRG